VIAEKSANAESYEHPWSMCFKSAKKKQSLGAMCEEHRGSGICLISKSLAFAIVAFAV
jgi:hypothetical protein